MNSGRGSSWCSIRSSPSIRRGSTGSCDSRAARTSRYSALPASTRGGGGPTTRHSWRRVILLHLALLVQAAGELAVSGQALDRAPDGARSGHRGRSGCRGGARAASVQQGRCARYPTVSYSHGDGTRHHFLVDQPLDWLLRRGPDRAAARAGIDRAEADSAVTVVGLVRDVRIVFYRARASRMAEALAAGQAALADSVARIASARLRAGDISLLERDQAAQEAARARQAASVAERDGAGEPQAELARRTSPGRAIRRSPAGSLAAGLDQLPDTTIDLRSLPTLRTAVADSAAAAAQARSASLGRVPMPAVQSGAEWDDDAQPGALAVVGLSIPFPIWNLVAAGQWEKPGLDRTGLPRLPVKHGSTPSGGCGTAQRIRLEETAARARFARDTVLPAAGVLRAARLRAYQAGETGILPVLDALRGERDVSLTALQRDQSAVRRRSPSGTRSSGRPMRRLLAASLLTVIPACGGSAETVGGLELVCQSDWVRSRVTPCSRRSRSRGDSRPPRWRGHARGARRGRGARDSRAGRRPGAKGKSGGGARCARARRRRRAEGLGSRAGRARGCAAAAASDRRGYLCAPGGRSGFQRPSGIRRRCCCARPSFTDASAESVGRTGAGGDGTTRGTGRCRPAARSDPGARYARPLRSRSCRRLGTSSGRHAGRCDSGRGHASSAWPSGRARLQEWTRSPTPARR